MVTGKSRKQDAQVQKLTYSALFLAVAQILPFVTGQIPEIGAMLCPMHIPALLCGFMCGWPWGMAVGFVAPLLRGFIFHMPVLFPTGIAMAFELATYGGVAGFLYHVLPRKKWITCVSLVLAMIAGRLVWGAAQLILSGFTGKAFGVALFLAGAVTNAIPGIILQLVLIPILVIAMERAGLSLNPAKRPKEQKASNEKPVSEKKETFEMI